MDYILLPRAQRYNYVIDYNMSNRNKLPWERPINVLDNMTDSDAYRRFRLTKLEIEYVVKLLKPILKRRTKRHGSLSTQHQLLIFLRFLASGSHQRVS